MAWPDRRATLPSNTRLMSASGSTKVVIAALAANGVIAVLKFAAATWTGSAAMLSEAIHSLADTANQGLLLHGTRQARRPADAMHPFGYAKELYFWAFVVAVLLFSLGAGVAIYEGIHKLQKPEPVTDPWVNYVVLGLAFVCEAGSTYFAVSEFNRQRGEAGALRALRGSKDPALYTVLLEDIAALIGLAVAFAGIFASHMLGWTMGDAIASIMIGIILGLVAAFMSIETKALIVGEAASPEVTAAIQQMLEREMSALGPIAKVHHLKTMHLGPDEVLVAACVAFKESESAATVQATVARLEREIQTRFPNIRHLYLEAQATEHAGVAATAPLAVVMAAGPAPSATAPHAPQLVPAAPRGNYPPPKPKGKKKRR